MKEGRKDGKDCSEEGGSKSIMAAIHSLLPSPPPEGAEVLQGAGGEGRRGYAARCSIIHGCREPSF